MIHPPRRRVHLLPKDVLLPVSKFIELAVQGGATVHSKGAMPEEHTVTLTFGSWGWHLTLTEHTLYGEEKDPRDVLEEMEEQVA